MFKRKLNLVNIYCKNTLTINCSGCTNQIRFLNKLHRPRPITTPWTHKKTHPKHNIKPGNTTQCEKNRIHIITIRNTRIHTKPQRFTAIMQWIFQCTSTIIITTTCHEYYIETIREFVFLKKFAWKCVVVQKKMKLTGIVIPPFLSMVS